ncbi:MAG: murein biosynthesis integral membrane protein MurJ [Anaerolineae bacterium]|nr:murein biosynthesis integral membrane protein MurJ [Anaerolineae bacterium]
MDRQTVIAGETRQVTRAAALISVGNVTSRVLGLVREMAKSYFFGAGGAVSAYDVAAQVPTMIYDLLAGQMLSSAIVPVFSDYASPEKRNDLWLMLNLMLTLLSLFLGGLIVLIEVAAPAVARLLSGGLPPEYLELATQMIRVTTPAILFLNVAGLFSGALYALQRFERPAFLGTISNATLLLVVVVLALNGTGPISLAFGLLTASIVQVIFQWSALRDAHIRFVSPFTRHPALRTISRLYLPIGLGLIVDQAAVALSFNLASRTGPSGIAWMKLAATIIQLPLGMVVTAISIAVLPTLSQYATNAEEEPFSATLAQGVRMVMALVLPAAVLLLILAEPMVALLFQRGSFMPTDTPATAMALRFNLLGLIFAALDQPLIFAFYARKDTWTPALVGIGTVVFYTLLALGLTLFPPINLNLLILANSFKLTAHALAMLWLYNRKIGALGPYHVINTSLRALAAAVIMALPVAGIVWGLQQSGLKGTPAVLTQVVVAGGVGAVIYVLLLRMLKVKEITLLVQALLSRWQQAKTKM